MKYLILTFFVLLFGTVSFAQVGAITSGTSYSFCTGSSITLSDTTSGGIWTSGNVSVATIGSSSGIVTGLSAGIVAVTYTAGGSSVAAVLTVNPVPAGISGIQSVCAGYTTTLLDGTTSGSWSSSNPAVATISGTGMVTGVAAGSVNILYTLPGGCSSAATVTVNTNPGAITGTASVCPGSQVTLSNPTMGGTWTSSNSGIAAIGYTTGVATGVGTGVVTVSYTLATGCFSATPLTVNVAPAAISGSNVCFGSSTILYCSTPGGTWTSGAPAIATIGGSSGVTAGISAGTTNITYTISTGCSSTKPLIVYPQPNAISGVSYVCEGAQITLGDVTTPGTFFASGGTASVTSSGLVTGITAGIATITYTESVHFCSITKNITVASTPFAYTLNAAGSTSYCSGGSGGVVIQLGTSQSGVNYQLYVSGTPTGTVIAGTGSPLNFAPASSPGNYTAVATSSLSGCSNAMTGTITVNVNPSPAVYTVSGGGAYCAGGAGESIGLSSSSLGINYQILVGLTPTGTMIPGNGTALSFGLQTTPGVYTVIATNPVTGCSSSMSGTPNIVVNPLPTSYSVTGSSSVCAGDTGTVFLSSSNSGIVYQLYRGTSTLGTAIPGTGAALSFTGLSLPGTYTIKAISTATTCSQTMSGSASIVVNPLPLADSVESTGSSYCAGGTGVELTLSSSQPGVSYQLFNGSSATGSPVLGTGAGISFGFQRTAGSYTVQAINGATGCTNTMNGIPTVTTLPAPTSHPVTGGGNYCAGTTGAAIGLLSSQTGVSYQVYLSGTPVSAPLPGTGSAINFGNFASVGTYSVVATNTSTGCTGNMPGSAIVGLNPLPSTYAVTGGGAYCIGGAGAHIGLSGSSTGVSYQLLNGGTPTGGMIAGTGSAIDFGLQTNSGNYTVNATDMTTSCSRPMGGSANIIVNTLPIAYSVTGGGTYCPGTGPVHIGLFSSNPGVTYTLKNSGIVEGTASGTGSAIDFGVYTAGGTYLVFATNTTTTCTSRMTDSAVITITTPIVPLVSVTSSTSDSICSGTVTHFAAIPVNGGSAPSYTWIVNGIISGTGNTFAYAPANGDVIYAQMASSAFCAMPLVVSSGAVSMTVSPSPVIGGPSDICEGSSAPFSGVPGCVWTSSAPSVAVVATVGSTTGVVSGVSAGSAIITCTLLGCYSTAPVTINPSPSVGVTAVASCGGIETLTATGAATYNWLPSSGLSCTTCSVTIAKPNNTTTYIVTGSLPTGCSDTAVVTVNANRISGFISYLGNATDIFKVWLIQFNPSDSSLTAEDSTSSCMASGIPYYEFNSKPAGSYMVKAKLLGSVPGASGYIPTYSLSTPHWYEAASIAHTNNSDSMHINMVYGTVPPGPGFVGGYISAGAGKGTSGAAPAQGMLVYLKDAVSNFVITYAYTDENGQYSFSNIGYGSYIVYPEEYGYTTLPSASFTLSSNADSMTGIDFREYSTSRIIRPVSATSVATIGSSNGTMTIFPNPASGLLNIRWAGQSAALANVVISDAVGRAVYKETLNMTGVNGTTQLNIGNIAHGMYLVTVSSGKIYYSWKLQISE